MKILAIVLIFISVIKLFMASRADEIAISSNYVPSSEMQKDLNLVQTLIIIDGIIGAVCGVMLFIAY